MKEGRTWPRLVGRNMSREDRSLHNTGGRFEGCSFVKYVEPLKASASDGRLQKTRRSIGLKKNWRRGAANKKKTASSARRRREGRQAGRQAGRTDGRNNGRKEGSSRIDRIKEAIKKTTKDEGEDEVQERKDERKETIRN